MNEIEKNRDRIGQAGRAAWKRLKAGANWNDWMSVGEALLIGREVAMAEAGTNAPEGKGYILAFNRWLATYELNDIDKSARAKLFTVMAHRSEIEAFRATLSSSDRLKLNHPTTVLRHWQAKTQVPTKPKPLTIEAARKLYAPFLTDLRSPSTRRRWTCC